MPSKRLITRNLASLKMQAETLKHVLHDKHLLECLKRRTKWIFTSNASLLITLASVSSFIESDISVILEIPYNVPRGFHDYEGFSSFVSNPTEVAVNLLAGCSKLTSLKIVLSEFEFDLAVIVRACPCLKILEIFETFSDQDIHFRGGLAGLSHLESVSIIWDG